MMTPPPRPTSPLPAYEAPAIVVLGSIAELTLLGVGTTPESLGGTSQ